MFPSKLKETLNTSIAEVVSDIDSFVYNPGRDYELKIVQNICS